MTRYDGTPVTTQLLRPLGVVALFSLLAMAYLHPGGTAMLKGRSDVVMSDGTDASTLPYQYSLLRSTWRTTPTRLLYGAVPAATLGAPEGFALWIPWIERSVVVALAPLFPVEQLSTVLVVVLMVLDGLAMYMLGRHLGWSRSLSLAIAIAWAFNATTRGRAKVHMSLVGTFHVPLVFLGLLLVAKGKGWRSIAAAAACFAAAATVAHYYLVILAFLVPWLLVYLLVSAGSPSRWLRVGVRIAAAALPAVMLVGWSYLKPLPPDFIKPGTVVTPSTGEAQGGQPHPFMTLFAARPVDYITGDIGIGITDWNPIRSWLSLGVLLEMDGAFGHERANGIRWIVWALALAGVVTAFRDRTSALWPRNAHREVFALALFGVFAFWLSLSPDVPVAKAGPSYWLYSLMPQIRVPSRAGIYAQFAVLMLAGLFFHQFFELAPSLDRLGQPLQPRPLAKRFAWIAKPAILPLLMVVEFPPFLQPMPMTVVEPAYAALQDEPCGPGLRFPYVSGDWELGPYYTFLQRMRGSNCQTLNAASPTRRDAWFVGKIGQQPQTMSALKPESELITRLTSLADCVPMTWVVFDMRVPLAVQQQWCASRRWTLSPDGVCRAPILAGDTIKSPEECF